MRVNKDIFPDQEPNYILQVYLSIVLEQERLIGLVAQFLEDPELHGIFEISKVDIENLVLYMYKWVFSQSAKYIDNASYLQKILELLETDNECKVYL